MSEHPVVVAVTGASGVVYGQRLLEVLLQSNIEVHLTISESVRVVAEHELGLEIDLKNFEVKQLLTSCSLPSEATSKLTYHHCKDFMTPIASGSFKTRGMVVCPCSGGTLSGIATAASRNLIQRAADVHLKERRPLVLVPREAPLSLIQIENMKIACAAGATILPASPGFYHEANSVKDLVDFVVARIVDQLGIECDLVKRWGSD
ncbi:MAG: UbiX family flavin prenyltransferase [Mariniblastus sp.]|nr:UbiX family flavin prenyltransferase [Mariniblastus sp.]